MHGVEELAKPPYLFGSASTYRIVLLNGRETEISCRRHDFEGWAQRYDRVGPLLGDEGLRTGCVLGATVHILECRVMWDRALAALGRDPLFFVERMG